MPISLSETEKQIFKTQTLEKEEQTKPKSSRRKEITTIRAEISKNRE